MVLAGDSGPNLKHSAQNSAEDSKGQASPELAGWGIEWAAKAILLDEWSKRNKTMSVKHGEHLGIMPLAQALSINAVVCPGQAPASDPAQGLLIPRMH